MTAKNIELYFDPVSKGSCEVLGCSNPAKYRASWSQGILVRLVCASHKSEAEGKRFEELSPLIFGGQRHLP